MSSLSLDSLDLYSSSITSTANSSKAEELANTLQNSDNSTDEELMDACKSFESYFLEQVFKSMEKTVMKDDSDTSSTTSSYTDYFQDMLTQQYAANATENGGYGLAQLLYDSMKRNTSSSSEEV